MGTRGCFCVLLPFFTRLSCIYTCRFSTSILFSGRLRYLCVRSAHVFLLSFQSKTVFELDKEAEPSGSVYSVDVYRGRQVLAHNLLATFRLVVFYVDDCLWLAFRCPGGLRLKRVLARFFTSHQEFP